MRKRSSEYLDKDFWLEERRHYIKPYFRLEKCASIINSLSRGKDCELLDVGCGPATLSGLLRENIDYFGIDLAILMPAPNLIEMDITQNEIGFRGMSFDIVVTAGLFEYLGNLQNQKLCEIRKILKSDGRFIATYTNFHHLNHERGYNDIYNNIQAIDDFKSELELRFCVDRWYPSSHNWLRTEPRRIWLKKIQMPLSFHLPIFSRLFAVNYFFICSLSGI